MTPTPIPDSTLIIVDFDGVIVDSRYETYLISKALLYGDTTLSAQHEQLWLQHRGLSVDGRGFLPLHKAIESYLDNPSGSTIPVLFQTITSQIPPEDLRAFEQQFFDLRETLMAHDLQAWLLLHQLTAYGSFLQNKQLPRHHILTTKNRAAVTSLLTHFAISIPHIYSWEEVQAAKSKGEVIRQLLDQNNTKAIYVDDTVEQLDTVRDPRVDCYFADWGYGTNTTYPVYQSSLWTV